VQVWEVRVVLERVEAGRVGMVVAVVAVADAAARDLLPV